MRFVGNLFTSLVLISTQVSAQDHTHDTAPVKSVHLPEKPSNYVHNYLKALSCAKVSDFKNPQMAVDDLHWDLASRLSEGDFTYEQFRQELISYYRGAMRDAPLFFGSEKIHLWLPEDPETLFHELDKLGSLMQAQRTQQSSEDAYWLKKNEVALNQSSKNIEAWVRRNKFNHYSIKNQNDCPPYVQTLFNNGGTFRNKIFSQKNADHFHTSRDFKTRHLNVDGSAREKFTPALHRPLTAEQTAQNIVDSIWCPHFTEQVWEMFYRLQNSEFQGPELAAELQKAIKHRAALGDRNGETSLEDLLQNDKNFSHNWTDLLNRINVLMKRPAIDVPADKVSVSSSLPYFEGAERANRLNGEFEYLRSSVQRLEQSLSPHLWKKIDTRKGKDLLKQQEGARPLMSTQSRKECQMPPSQLGSDFLRYSLQKNRHSASQKSKALRDEHQVKLNELLALEKSKTKEFLDRIALLPKQEDTERSVLNKELTDLKLQHQGAEEALPKIIAADLKSFQADLEQSFADEEEALMHTLQVKYENEIEKNGEWNFKGACFNHKNEAITNNKILSEIYGRFSDELVNNLMKIRKNPASKVDASSQTIARFQKAMYLGCAESDFHMITLAPHGRETEGQYSREFSLEKIDEMLSGFYAKAKSNSVYMNHEFNFGNFQQSMNQVYKIKNDDKMGIALKKMFGVNGVFRKRNPSLTRESIRNFCRPEKYFPGAQSEEVLSRIQSSFDKIKGIIVDYPGDKVLKIKAAGYIDEVKAFGFIQLACPAANIEMGISNDSAYYGTLKKVKMSCSEKGRFSICGPQLTRLGELIQKHFKNSPEVKNFLEKKSNLGTFVALEKARLEQEAQEKAQQYRNVEQEKIEIINEVAQSYASKKQQNLNEISRIEKENSEQKNILKTLIKVTEDAGREEQTRLRD